MMSKHLTTAPLYAKVHQATCDAYFAALNCCKSPTTFNALEVRDRIERITSELNNIVLDDIKKGE